jgi:hypothetical protein
MTFLRRTVRKLLRRRRLHAEIDAELALHRELSRENGNPIGLGNATAIKESALDLWRFTLIENTWRDLLFADSDDVNGPFRRDVNKSERSDAGICNDAGNYSHQSRV